METILAITEAIRLSLLAAKSVELVVQETIKWVNGLFASGAITAEQQSELLNWVQQVTDALERDEIPPHWTVEPDPT